MRILGILSAVVLAVGSALGQEDDAPTALAALKLLPKAHADSLARIEAREGKPAPDRWHILVHDAKSDTGVHEYVIEGEKIVASRAVSQFADAIRPDDVVGAGAVKVDSNKVAKVAQSYATANKATPASINYQLVHGGDGSPPVWRVTCEDATGKTLGTVVMKADDGAVLSHAGFPVKPQPAREKSEAKRAPKRTEPSEGTIPARSVPSTASRRATPVAPAPPPVMENTEPPRQDRSFFRRAGGKMQKFFTGRDSNSR
jgi:hypothetical protein